MFICLPALYCEWNENKILQLIVLCAFFVGIESTNKL